MLTGHEGDLLPFRQSLPQHSSDGGSDGASNGELSDPNHPDARFGGNEDIRGRDSLLSPRKLEICVSTLPDILFPSKLSGVKPTGCFNSRPQTTS